MQDISKEIQTTGVTHKQETWRTRNRQNQKRFRDKQKASRDLLQQEVHEMAQRLQQLEAQNEDLERRGIMLKRLLKTKHEQAQILQNDTHKQVDFNCLLTTPPTRQQSPVSWSTRRRQRQFMDSGPQPSSHNSLKAPDSLYKPALSLFSDNASSGAHARNSGSNILSSDSSDPCSIVALQSSNPFDLANPTFNWRDHQFCPFSANPQATGTSPLDVNQTYSAIVDGLKKLLTQLQVQGGMTRDLEHEFDCQTDAKIQAQNKLSEQKSSGSEPLSAISVSSYMVAEQSTPGSSQDLNLSEDMLKVQALSTSLQQHHQAWVQFYVQIFNQVWSSEQYARAVVASGPYHVDALAIATCAAEDKESCLCRVTGTVQDAKSCSPQLMQLAAVDAVF